MQSKDIVEKRSREHWICVIQSVYSNGFSHLKRHCPGEVFPAASKEASSHLLCNLPQLKKYTLVSPSFRTIRTSGLLVLEGGEHLTHCYITFSSFPLYNPSRERSACFHLDVLFCGILPRKTKSNQSNFAFSAGNDMRVT